MAKYLFHSRNIIFQHLRLPLKRHMCVKVDDLRRGCITVKSDNPFDLFNEWLHEVTSFVTLPINHCFVLSTYSPKNKVTSRIMKFIKHKDDKFYFGGVSHTEKMKDLATYPDVSMCVWWYYNREKYLVMRQVRIRGVAKEIEKSVTTEMFPKMPKPLQVEFLISRQNEPVSDWFGKQAEFSKAIAQYKSSNIKMPDYITVFEIKVEEIQFFHNIVKTDPFFIADRVLFKKDGEKWKYTHIGA